LILVDTNVIVATVIVEHFHHRASREACEILTDGSPLLTAHCVAEAYSTITRSNGPYRLPRDLAWTMLASVIDGFTVVAMTAPQALDAVRRFSTLGIGPRLYDYLIGATGEAHGVRTLVTWNVKDFAPLFPNLTVVTPDAYQPTLRPR